MGACASCLGIGRRRNSEVDEHTRLLNGDEYGNGSHPTSYMPTAEDVIRDREELQRIVAQTSENLIDISTLKATTGEQNAMAQQPASAFQQSRTELFRKLLQEANPPHLQEMPQVLDSTSVSVEEREWLDELADSADEVVELVKTVHNVGSLVARLD